uniref:Leukocyte elastase inhibitor n=1 Tax=Scleropages formosus TaxID=113540 RepID=A0A8C9RJY7_SCLFO
MCIHSIGVSSFFYLYFGWHRCRRSSVMESVSAASTHFTLDLFKKITSNNKTGNVFFSPISISSSLAMVYPGARGDTATEMSKCLHFYRAGDNLHDGFNKLFSELNKAEAAYSLSLANRLYGEKSYEFVEKFLADTKKHYQAELEPVDFRFDAEAARVNINTWVEKQTQGKIKNLLANGVVDSLTTLVLVNAIYFKGNWEKKFKESATREQPFKLNKNDTKPVKMMYQKSKFNFTFIPEVQCQILELPYIGNELSMLIMLPSVMEDDSTGLEKLEQQLTYDNLMEWTRPDMMEYVTVNVGLPRFKMEDSYNMKETLSGMGMVKAFDGGDFSGMSPRNDLLLSEVVHKAFVEVNEEGTEAAAATAAVMIMRCAPLPPTSFIADHPFLFLIRHNPSKSILFYGRFCSP